MNNRLSQCFLVTLCMCISSTAIADIFSITDADFVDGVYEFRYYSKTNIATVNGTPISFASLVMTNDGFSGPVPEGGGAYWEATGHFGAVQLAGSVTLGWDLSAVSTSVDSVEFLTNIAIFQFDPWAPNALEDKIYAEIATPTTFGTGPYTRYSEFVGDGNGTIGAYANVGAVQDVTSILSSSWLSDPDLLELRLGYQQHVLDGAHPNIPGKHLQIFRDSSGTGDDSFLLRITAVPEPATFLLITISACFIGILRRRS